MKAVSVVSVCPQVEGGMPIPRPRAEISAARGAGEALVKCKAKGIRLTVLKEGESCLWFRLHLRGDLFRQKGAFAWRDGYKQQALQFSAHNNCWQLSLRASVLNPPLLIHCRLQ